MVVGGMGLGSLLLLWASRVSQVIPSETQVDMRRIYRSGELYAGSAAAGQAWVKKLRKKIHVHDSWGGQGVARGW